MKNLGSPKLNWKDNKTPISERFDDVYFSVDDGLAESLYVFVNGCGLPDGFAGRRTFTVGETGFGTGLNFLLTWQAWKEAKTDCMLNYFSVEAFPIERDALAQTLAQFEELAPYVQEFLKHYPVLTPGFHHIVLENGRVKLTLMFGDAADMFGQMEGKVDAWYLDGFAPAKNPEMWREDVFAQIGRLSQDGAILSTFTAAGFVKRGLRDVGFEIDKRRGYGRKRESLWGTFRGQESVIATPWFAQPDTSATRKKIAVIGAGIAGCVTARRLIEDGHDVVLMDRNETAGQEGSGNRFGLIKPRLTLGSDFNTRSYLQSVAFYDQLNPSVWKGQRGLFQMAEDDADLLRQKMLIAHNILPKSHMVLLSAAEASEKLGYSVARSGLWFPHAGYIEPAFLCRFLSQSINGLYSVDISAIVQTDNGWQVKAQDEVLFEGDCVVIATAGENSALNTFSHLPMGGRRGQVSYITPTPLTETLKAPISCGGYFIPAEEGYHIVGATFDRWPDFFDHSYRDVNEESHAKNLEKMQTFAPGWEGEVVGARASIRAMTQDHIPIVGPVHSDEWYTQAYERLKHGKRAGSFVGAQYVDGLYTMCGLGARGIQAAPMLADVLSSYINATPCPIENTHREALHPARFLIRQLRKAQP